MKNFFGPVLTFTKMNLLRFFRDKVYIFFMVLLPVLFLMLFGMMYGGMGDSTLVIAIFNKSDSALATGLVDSVKEQSEDEEQVLEVADISEKSEADDKLIRGEINAIIELPENFGEIGEDGKPHGEIVVIYSAAYEQTGQLAVSVFESIASSMNIELSGTEPNITVSAKSDNTAGLSNFDYVFSGLLGYTIMTVGLMGIANILPSDKESGATKRLRATTVSASQLVIGYALTFLALGVLILSIMVILGLTVFNFNMRGNWFDFAIFASISTVMMLGFGLAIGGWAKNEAQGSALMNLTMFPMMFLSGVFIPKFFMPEFVQGIMNFIPLTPIVDGIRLIITESYTLVDVLPQLGLIAIWGVIIYAIAIKVFRWD